MEILTQFYPVYTAASNPGSGRSFSRGDIRVLVPLVIGVKHPQLKPASGRPLQGRNINLRN